MVTADGTDAAAGELMQHLQVKRSTGDVPAELFDLDHQVWRSTFAFSQWCRQHGIREPNGRTWAERYQRARDRWMIANGFTVGASGRQPDYPRLLNLGVPWAGSLTRAMAKAEAEAPDPEGFRSRCKLAPYGPVPDVFPRTDPRRA